MKTYGGLKPHFVVGSEGFMQHNALTTWDNQGIGSELAHTNVDEFSSALQAAVEHLRENLRQDFDNVIAVQVRDAVHDYASNSFADVALIDGELCLLVDFSNQASEFRIAWNLPQLMAEVAAQAAQSGDLQLLEALQTIMGRAQVSEPVYTRDAISLQGHVSDGRMYRTHDVPVQNQDYDPEPEPPATSKRGYTTQPRTFATGGQSRGRTPTIEAQQAQNRVADIMGSLRSARVMEAEGKASAQPIVQRPQETKMVRLPAVKRGKANGKG